MGFGRSDAEKQRDTEIATNNQVQRDMAEQANKRANKSFKWFRKSVEPTRNFWTTILEGDRNAVNSLFAPEIGAIGKQFDTALQSNAVFTPRGGARASGTTQILNDKAKAISDILLKARPMAAEQLANLGGLFAGTSGQQSGISSNLFGNVNSALFGLNEQEQRRRDAQAQFWGGLGAGAGQLAGGYLFGKFGG